MKNGPDELRPIEVEDHEPIHLPLPSPLGFATAFFAVILGFALIWHIWWLAILGLIGALGLLLKHSWRMDTETEVSAQQIAKFDRNPNRAIP
jgi:cytochrome o ubiquinol oxidase subunit 1